MSLSLHLIKSHMTLLLATTGVNFDQGAKLIINYRY